MIRENTLAGGWFHWVIWRASQVELVEKSSACQCMQVRSLSQEDSHEGGHDNPCLQTFMDRGTWQTMVHKAAKVRHYWSNLACMYCQYKYFYILKQVFSLKMYLHITVWLCIHILSKISSAYFIVSF